MPDPSPAGLAAAEAFAARVAAEDGVRLLTIPALQELMARAARENVYLIDVRTVQEYAQEGHIPGFQWSPGGQAVQRSDDLVGVRNGHVVFACDGRVRAAVTASWYRQMGFPNVYAVDGGTNAWIAAGLGLKKSQEPGESGGYDEGLQEELPFGYEQARVRVEGLIETLDLLEHQRVRSTIHEPIVESSHETLEAWRQVYEGCADEEIAQIEAIALDRSRFIRQEPSATMEPALLEGHSSVMPTSS